MVIEATMRVLRGWARGRRAAAVARRFGDDMLMSISPITAHTFYDYGHKRLGAYI